MSEKTRAFAVRLMQEVWEPFDLVAVPRFDHADMVGYHRAQVLMRNDIVRRLEWDRRNFTDAVYHIQDIVADTTASLSAFSMPAPSSPTASVSPPR